uniref:Uncharacterized protein n=1 Tax=Arundo donax TaxID=35708 RepID=A0A0A9BQL8_ARUDO
MVFSPLSVRADILRPGQKLQRFFFLLYMHARKAKCILSFQCTIVAETLNTH